VLSHFDQAAMVLIDFPEGYLPMHQPASNGTDPAATPDHSFGYAQLSPLALIQENNRRRPIPQRITLTAPPARAMLRCFAAKFWPHPPYREQGNRMNVRNRGGYCRRVFGARSFKEKSVSFDPSGT
jgi:hypothetical protein